MVEVSEQAAGVNCVVPATPAAVQPAARSVQRPEAVGVIVTPVGGNWIVGFCSRRAIGGNFRRKVASDGTSVYCNTASPEVTESDIKRMLSDEAVYRIGVFWSEEDGDKE
ncbi:MAG: hypothetical protein ACRDSI_17600 [Pseudonocardiaceae bacterium]